MRPSCGCCEGQLWKAQPPSPEKWPRLVVLKSYHESESPGGVTDPQISRPHFQSFWASGPGGRPENGQFQRIPRWRWCCWSWMTLRGPRSWIKPNPHLRVTTNLAHPSSPQRTLTAGLPYHRVRPSLWCNSRTQVPQGQAEGSSIFSPPLLPLLSFL